MKSIVQEMKIKVTKKRIKKMYLRVSTKDGSVNISAPIGTPDNIIREFLESNIQWIQEKQAKVLADKDNLKQPLENGSTINLWGQKYAVLVRPATSNAVILRGNDIVIYLKNTTAEAILEKWCRRKLQEKIIERSVHWESIVGKKASEYVIRKMTRCWGNCRPKTGRITINYELIHKPVECLDYVLVHELVHFYEIYHNDRFWSLVGRFYPDYKYIRQFLRDTF